MKPTQVNRAAALEAVLVKYLPGFPPTLQQVRQDLGLKSKASIYEDCWAVLTGPAIEAGRIANPQDHPVWNKGTGQGRHTTLYSRHGVAPMRTRRSR